MDNLVRNLLLQLQDKITAQVHSDVRRFELRVAPGYSFQGFSYNYDLETMSDCQKIYHEVRDLDGSMRHMDWSPYDTPTEAEFQAWILIGRPERIGCGPLRTQDLLVLIRLRLDGYDQQPVSKALRSSQEDAALGAVAYLVSHPVRVRMLSDEELATLVAIKKKMEGA